MNRIPNSVKLEFEQKGYATRETEFFGDGELLIGEVEDAGGINVYTERSVFLYPEDDAWIVRRTPHGGPHLVDRRSTLSDAKNLCYHYLPKPPAAQQSGGEGRS